jgi:hypothetical protein
MYDLDIIFYESDKLQTRTTDDEYNEIMSWLDKYPNDKDFVAFDVLNGKSEITFRSKDVKYLIKR